MSRNLPPVGTSPHLAGRAPGQQSASTEPGRLSSQLGLFAFDVGAPITLYYLLAKEGLITGLWGR